jgi:hypothetical protein
MIPKRNLPSGLIAKPSIPRLAWRPDVLPSSSAFGSALGLAVARGHAIRAGPCNAEGDIFFIRIDKHAQLD